jgi:hypothetical protein
MPLTITDEDIDRVEPFLLSAGEKFDIQYRRAFIKNLSTVDVNACPGSGKTTALLAKIMILADKMPFDDGRGICVLTHTNVAIDEIKEKLGSKSNILFSHPNFFGTFQRFVDKYLAIPAYIKRYGKKPIIIDNEIHSEIIDRGKWTFLGKMGKHFCMKNDKKGYPNSISLYHFNLAINKCTELNLDLTKPKEKEAYDELRKLKEFAIENGYLMYSDAYFLAEEYLSKYTALKNIISSRFKFVFIDEMQDTDEVQLSILTNSFNANTVIQKIGDPCQAIYSAVRKDQLWKPSADALLLPESKRFGSQIANVIRGVCIDPANHLSGNTQIDSKKPIIILFDNSNIDKVINKFAAVIKEYRLNDKLPDGKINIFKAIGWVGKDIANEDSSKLCIKSYFPKFSRSATNVSRRNWTSLRAFLKCNWGQNPQVCYESLFNAMIRILRIAKRRNDKNNNRSFSKTTLNTYLSQKDEKFYEDFKKLIAMFCRRIMTEKDLYTDFVSYLKNIFLPFLGVTYNKSLCDFIEASENELEQSIRSASNYFETNDSQKLSIKIGTIHSVKGETHTGTLYLETFYRGCESDKIIEFMKAKGTNNLLEKTTVYEALKMAYVGMSRPTHLLCVAMHKDRIVPHRADLENLWQIVEAS